jgi:hypothetical protein
MVLLFLLLLPAVAMVRSKEIGQVLVKLQSDEKWSPALDLSSQSCGILYQRLLLHSGAMAKSNKSGSSTTTRTKRHVGDCHHLGRDDDDADSILLCPLCCSSHRQQFAPRSLLVLVPLWIPNHSPSLDNNDAGASDGKALRCWILGPTMPAILP